MCPVRSVTYVSGRSQGYLCLRSLTAAILTFPLFGDLPQKTVLSTVCQFHVSPDPIALRVVRGILALVTILGGLGPQEITRPEEHFCILSLTQASNPPRVEIGQ